MLSYACWHGWSGGWPSYVMSMGLSVCFYSNKRHHENIYMCVHVSASHLFISIWLTISLSLCVCLSKFATKPHIFQTISPIAMHPYCHPMACKLVTSFVKSKWKKIRYSNVDSWSTTSAPLLLHFSSIGTLFQLWTSCRHTLERHLPSVYTIWRSYYMGFRRFVIYYLLFGHVNVSIWYTGMYHHLWESGLDDGLRSFQPKPELFLKVWPLHSKRGIRCENFNCDVQGTRSCEWKWEVLCPLFSLAAEKRASLPCFEHHYTMRADCLRLIVIVHPATGLWWTHFVTGDCHVVSSGVPVDDHRTCASHIQEYTNDEYVCWNKSNWHLRHI